MNSQIFKWEQSSGKTWIIEANFEEKYIKTTDEKGNVIQEETNMPEDLINFMIETFIKPIISIPIPTSEAKNPNLLHNYDSMYA